MSKLVEMEKIRDEVTGLKNSPLYDERVRNGYVPVIGEGSLDAQVVFVGEAPGKNEAVSGTPFCGASGKVLDQLLAHVGMRREDVYITNIVKDRPTDNRDPRSDEIALYAPFLIRQIEIIQPCVIATLGRFSMEFIMRHYGLESEVQSISSLHGKVFKIQTSKGDLSIIPLFHPAVAVYGRTRMGELMTDMETLKQNLDNLQ